ncbi:MAG: GrpB family protein [Candidatus Nomurabacteria bacterium]|nr:GrpB family protein [Candidatus Nomurabacteria bacterium]
MENNHQFFTKYQEFWKTKFEIEKEKITKTFENKYDVLNIEHIGSTSIPGLSAKPIIDIAVLVNSIDNIDPIINLIQELGYVYYPKMSSAERIFCRKGDPVEYHLSVSSPKFSFWRRQILFRDYLINNPKHILEYQNLKENNLKITPEKEFVDLSLGEVYNSGKTEFVKKILDFSEDQIIQEKYFIAIPILGQVKDLVLNIHKIYSLDSVLLLAEPHITIKAPGGLLPNELWIANFEEIIKNYKSFRLSFKNIGVFNNSVLYLESDSKILIDMHNKLINKLNCSPELKSRYFEGSQYIPHTTLIQFKKGFYSDIIKKDIESELLKIKNTKMEVKEIFIYKQSKPEDTFIQYKTIKLN